jgi:hypothetical protein
LQKADALQAMKSDLEETVSGLKMEEYERALRRAKTLDDLRAVEFQVGTDARLRPDHKSRLLKKVERSCAMVKTTTLAGKGSGKTEVDPVALNVRVSLS